MADKFDPYHKWLGIPPRDQPPHHYRLLSIDLFESDREVIDAAARRLAVYVKSCATGPHQAEAKKLLAEIVQARLCLMDPQLRAAYDQRLAAPPPGAPPVEIAVEAAAEKPASATPRRTSRSANSGTLATARPLADTPPPELPSPPAPAASRIQPVAAHARGTAGAARRHIERRFGHGCGNANRNYNAARTCRARKISPIEWQ